MIRKIISMLIAIALCCPAVFVSAAVDEGYLSELEDKTAEIEALVSECEANGITPDYEKVDLEILRRFKTRMREDMEDLSKPGFPAERIDYNKAALEKIYNEAKENLTAYLDGTKTAEGVPRYVTGSLKPKGRSMVGTAEKDGVIQEERPLFMTGYGHFNEAERDIPLFQNFGANMIQTEVGPNATYGESAGYLSWPSNKVDAFSGTFEAAPGEGKSGDAMKFTNSGSSGYNYIRQSVRVKPNTSYEVGFFAKAPGLPEPGPHILRFAANTPYYYSEDNQGTGGLFNNYSVVGPSDDFKEWKAKYKTGPNQTVMTIYIGCFGQLPNPVLIDDAYVKRVGRKENLLVNGEFEQEGDEPKTFGEAPNKVFEYGIDMGNIFRAQDVLKSAEENNIAVSMLISSHYFPEFIMREEPETRYPNERVGGFMPCNINHPTVREVEKEFIDLALPYIKDYKSLNNIVLSNEPAYQICHVGEKYYGAQWEEYLERTYSDIDELNSLYGKNYADFSEVPLPTGSVPEIDTWDIRAKDFSAFNYEQFGGFHKFLADCVKEAAPSIPVNAKMLQHVFASEWDTWRQSPFRGTSPEMFAEFCEISGNDALGFIGGGGDWQDDPNNWWRDTKLYPKLMWHDFQRSIKEAPIYNSEDHVLGDNAEYYIPQEAVRLRADLWQSAVHGRNMDTIWLWEVHRDPNADFSDSISTRADCIEVVGDTNLDLNRLAYEVTALQNKKGDVALCYSETSRIYSDETMDSVYYAYKALNDNGQKADFVTDTSMAKMSREELNEYPMLVLPDVTNPTEEMFKKIENYTGKLVIINPIDRSNGMQYSLKKNENGVPYDAARYNAVYQRATCIEPSTWSDGDGINPSGRGTIERGIKAAVKELNPKVMLTDANGRDLKNVEWWATEYNGKTLVNICSYNWDNYDPWNKITDIKINVDGKPAALGKDLITGEEFNGTIGIQPYIPRLIELEDNIAADDIILTVDGEESPVPGAGINAANVTVTNYGETDETLTLYIAIYDGNVLDESALDTKTVAAGEEADFSAVLPELTEEDLEGKTVKAFLWNEDMQPITKREFK